MITDEQKRNVVMFQARKGYGYSLNYGTAFFGFCQFGRDNPYAGIYQRKKTKTAWKTSRMLFYWPTNPRTTLQQSRRTLFADGVLHWRSLTDGERAAYNERAKRFRVTGYNLHLSKWLRGEIA